MTGATDIWPLIKHMKEHGSALDMNWGEDNGVWEVAWITGGTRFVGHSRFLVSALLAAGTAACDQFGVVVPDVMRDFARAGGAS